MKKLFPLIFFSSIILSLQSNAQLRFLAADSIPVIVNSDTLANPWVGGINYPLWSEIDLNGDGTHDLVMYDIMNDRLCTFLNDGTQGAHPFHYSPQYELAFPVQTHGSWIVCYDYNCDGKQDLFALDSAKQGIAVYRNDYSLSTGLKFTLVNPEIIEAINPDSNNFPWGAPYYVPAFIDVDNDGDFDILTWNASPDGRAAWHRNYSVEDGLPCDSFEFKLESTDWGKFQLCMGSNQVCTWHTARWQGSVLSPDDTQREAAKRDDTVTSIFAFDNDGDGVKDLLVGDISSEYSLFLHNSGTPQVADMDSIQQDLYYPGYDSPATISMFHTHAYIDIDNDGTKDLLVSVGTPGSQNQRGVWSYKNDGTNTSPLFHLQSRSFMQDEMIDVGEAAHPVFFDENADGLPDLIIANTIIDYGGTIVNGLSLFRNIGTVTTPAFQFITDDYASVHSLNLPTAVPVHPAFGDMDGDSVADMILGTFQGKLYFFHNSAAIGSPANFSLTTPGYMNIDVGNASAPQIIDLNRDGLSDLLIGNQNGILKYYQNTGTPTAPAFSNIPTIDTLGRVNVQAPASTNGFAVPYVFDDSLHYRMLISNMQGNVYLYDNIDGNLHGTFTRTDTLISRTLGTRIFYNLTVSGGDINGDGLVDMAVGLTTGGVKIYYQSSSRVGISEHPAIKPSFDIFPNPAKDNLSVQLWHLPSNEKNIFRILNSTGAVVFEKAVSENKFNIDLQNFSSGFYMIQLLTSDGQVTTKLSVMH